MGVPEALAVKSVQRIGTIAWLMAALVTGACEERAPTSSPKPSAPPAPTPAAPPQSAPAPSAATGTTGAAQATGATAPSAAVAAPAPAKASEPPKQWETDNGVLIEELKIGEGEDATKFSDVKVHYIGTLANGREFDNSYRQNKPLVVNLGTGMIIKGWKDGIPGMKVGGKRRLTIPPEMAYGKSGHPPMIGPDAMLVFEVELLEIVK